MRPPLSQSQKSVECERRSTDSPEPNVRPSGGERQASVTCRYKIGLYDLQ
jgi:hypothetical protein